MMEPISIDDASLLLKFKSKVTLKKCSIFGSVNAVSELIQIKGKTMFLIQLKSNKTERTINIVVTDKDYLHWRESIQPRSSYLFINLRPTTLSKGTPDEQLVYVPYGDSSVRTAENVKVISLQELLKKSGDASSLSECENLECLETTGEKTKKLYDYQGTITSTCRAEHGLYELDGKIGLQLTFIPAVHQYKFLSVGTKIVVYNAHHCVADEHPKIRLCCCLISSIHVLECPPSTVQPAPYYHNRSVISHLLNYFNLNQAQVLWLLKCEKKLRQKFCPDILSVNELLKVGVKEEDGSVGSGVFSMLFTTKCPIKGEPLLCRAKRKILQEFLAENHKCGITERTVSKESLHRIRSVAEINQEAVVTAGNYVDLKKDIVAKNMTARDATEYVYWSHLVFENSDFTPPWIVVGVIETCNKTGRLQLRDQTGSIDCLVAQYASDSMEYHFCNTDCARGKTMAPPFFHSCPLPQSWIDGQLVRITKFQIVIERFLVCSLPHPSFFRDEKHIQQKRVHVYLQFAIEDAVTLHRRKFSNNAAVNRDADVDLKCKKRKLEPKKSSQSASTEPLDDSSVSHLVLITHKEPLKLQRHARSAPQLCFSCIATFIGEPSLNVPGAKESLEPGIDSCINQPEIYLRSTGPTRHENVNCIQRSNAEANHGSTPSDINKSTEVASHTATGKEAPAVLQTSEIATPSRPVALNLQGSSIKWFPYIHVGGLYRLTAHNTSSAAVFQAKLGGKHSAERAMTVYPTRQCVDIRDNMTFDYILFDRNSSSTESDDAGDVKNSGRGMELCNVQDINNNSSMDKLVSFKGWIKSKTFTTQSNSRPRRVLPQDLQKVHQDMGISFPDGKSMKLLVGDLASSDNITVYLKADNQQFCLGLLLGAVVEFRRFEKRLSENNKLYCHDLITSHVRVVCFPPFKGERCSMRTPECTADSSFTDLPSLPLQYLGSLWDISNSTRHSPFQCVCHVHQVLTVELRSVCVECSNLHKAGNCTYSPCSSVVSPAFQAKASIIIDDGSCNALVYCSGQSVQTLLDMSDQQWTDWKEFLSDVGELHYSHSARPDEMDHNQKALQQLCRSALVLKPMKIFCKPFSKESKHHSAHGLEDFMLKTLHVGQGTIQSRVLPLCRLYCLGMERINYHESIRQLMTTI
ncbi:CST complex subunit CTC1 [Lingula anatina]|uniref:CST complex subunit CTC1 n=1 Tax=Lingula anatina TaxID=7574 RepID=A0A1S3IJ28_LINAN|nr:CST complex subunit CTC1 [Lingula anatina]|eukprot:XP_013398217.1 CST complex subunit CTC1 [Lingula anatina]